MIEKLLYDLQFALICFLPPEDVVKLKPWIHENEYNMYFAQEYIKVYICKEQIENTIYTADNIEIVYYYLENLIRCGLKMGGTFDYAENKMKDILFGKIEPSDIWLDKDKDGRTYIDVEDDIFEKAYTQLLSEKLNNPNSIVSPNVQGLIIGNESGFKEFSFNDDSRCTRKDIFNIDTLGRMFTNRYQCYKSDRCITVEDLINAVWNIKSSKVDIYYEMFRRCTSVEILQDIGNKEDDDNANNWYRGEKVESYEHGKILHLQLSFDHGS
jgi:hypothetical protein